VRSFGMKSMPSARPMAVICLVSRINIFTNEDICLAIAELALVKDADFHHSTHLLSWNLKNPPPTRRASEWIAVRIATECRWHDCLHPAPRCPTGNPRDTGTPFGVQATGIRYSIAMTPHVHFRRWPTSFITTFPSDGGNPGECIGFLLRCEIFFYILVLAYKTTASHVSYIGSGRKTRSVVSRIFD